QARRLQSPGRSAFGLAARPLSQPPIDVTTMRNSDNDDQQRVVMDLVNDAVIADTDAIKALVSGELHRSRRTRILAQGLNFPIDSPLRVAGQVFKFPPNAGS